MKNLLAQQLDEVLGQANVRAGLACAGPLRVGAATLSRAEADDVTATTVVSAIGLDDREALEALAAEIAAEYDLDADVSFGATSFSVRFSRPSKPTYPIEVGGSHSIWTRIVSGLV